MDRKKRSGGKCKTAGRPACVKGQEIDGPYNRWKEINQCKTLIEHAIDVVHP